MVPRPSPDASRAHSDALRAAFTFPQDTISNARWALHWLLVALTLCTTTLVGVVLTQSFQFGQPLELDQYLHVFTTLHYRPHLLLDGLAFSLTLMTILLAHELGHYFACRYYGIDASLPYFLPFPLSPIGTLGAFIRIRSPIYTRQALFDVGIAGPLAGFAVLLPFLVIGIGASKIIYGINQRGDLMFGVPAIQRFFEWIIFPHARSSDILLHPIGRAAWVGILATALNLLPIGQLDGGHILYAFTGRRHKLLSRIFVLALIPLGIFYSPSWFVWAALLFFFALRHPVIYDTTKLDKNRVLLGFTALAIFLLTFMLAPLR
ncbi:MAG TPA: site-2 protease family protein [Bryobacteraceae bacterium]|nr:site-2 protease family protein [Bryobacteraceae bacterium]